MTRFLLTAALLLGTTATAQADHEWRETLSRQYRYERDAIRRDANRQEDRLRDWYQEQREQIRHHRDRALRHTVGRDRSAVHRHFRLQEDRLNDRYNARRKSLSRSRGAALDAARHRYDTARRQYEHTERYGPSFRVQQFRLPNTAPAIPHLHQCDPQRRNTHGSIRLPIAGGVSIRF